jgi:hypothetical protein
MPEHMNLVDVFGEANKVIIEMQATSPPLAIVLAALPSILIPAAIAIGIIILSIVVSVKVAQVAPNFVWVGMFVLAATFLLPKLFKQKEQNVRSSTLNRTARSWKSSFKRGLAT